MILNKIHKTTLKPIKTIINDKYFFILLNIPKCDKLNNLYKYNKIALVGKNSQMIIYMKSKSDKGMIVFLC